MAAPSCAFTSGIPNPPTTSPSCAVPIGGSNSTLLDTCCNGHINPINTYSAPGADDDCYQYCTTDAVNDVQGCLTQKFEAYDKNSPAFQCFNVAPVKAAESKGGRIKGAGWILRVAVGLGVVGAVVGMV
ncbi:hypothetical protein BU26DRAFT_31974 [Trematosphaeria pertusa]|uniref:Uncharacterized protein n=1 Tax=Trematosphaeria pertusa TaxID=390896 RepID=A0A6A6J239_9PLEO|nr:uncharacterized protein BU26DRAFT_31974 [Trematosphaeria pertusa]KAF2256915.1 hypothetical protein BU26DRAFT_31974 [Trematosphaeria pertusa]